MFYKLCGILNIEHFLTTAEYGSIHYLYNFCDMGLTLLYLFRQLQHPPLKILEKPTRYRLNTHSFTRREIVIFLPLSINPISSHYGYHLSRYTIGSKTGHKTCLRLQLIQNEVFRQFNTRRPVSFGQVKCEYISYCVCYHGGSMSTLSGYKHTKVNCPITSSSTLVQKVGQKHRALNYLYTYCALQAWYMKMHSMSQLNVHVT